MRDICCGRYYGPRALTGLVGEDAPLHAHGNGGAYDAAANWIEPEGALHDGPNNRRNVLDMICNHNKRQDNIAKRHERRHNRRNARNALHPSKDHQPQDHRQANSGSKGSDREGIIYGRCRPV